MMRVEIRPEDNASTYWVGEMSIVPGVGDRIGIIDREHHKTTYRVAYVHWFFAPERLESAVIFVVVDKRKGGG